VAQAAKVWRAEGRAAALGKAIAAKNLAASGLPDPKCHTGVISVFEEGKPQACCAGYCGECSDYPTCMTVRGQNSTNACCASQVVAMACPNAPANVCMKSCTESVPPCIMDDGMVFTTPDPSTRHAGRDCDEAVTDWRAKAASAVAPSGEGATAPTKKDGNENVLVEKADNGPGPGAGDDHWAAEAYQIMPDSESVSGVKDEASRQANYERVMAKPEAERREEYLKIVAEQ